MTRILAVFLLAFPAFGTTVNLGVNAFADGSTPSTSTFTSAVDPPFNVISGSDALGPSASFTLTFDTTPAPVGVTSASLLISLYDLDSASAGSQIGSFIVGGVDLTSTLNSLAETAHSTQSQITYFNVTLPASAFTAIQSGSVVVSLSFAGSGLAGAAGGTSISSDHNSGGIDFATLTYDTGVVTPEPSSFLLAAGGGLAMFLRKKRLGFRRG